MSVDYGDGPSEREEYLMDKHSFGSLLGVEAVMIPRELLFVAVLLALLVVAYLNSLLIKNNLILLSFMYYLCDISLFMNIFYS